MPETGKNYESEIEPPGVRVVRDRFNLGNDDRKYAVAGLRYVGRPGVAPEHDVLADQVLARSDFVGEIAQVHAAFRLALERERPGGDDLGDRRADLLGGLRVLDDVNAAGRDSARLER